MKEDVLLEWSSFLLIHKGQMPRGVERYNRVVGSFADWLKANHDKGLLEVSRADILQWQADLFLTQGNMSNSTRASKLSALKSFYKYTTDEGHTPANHAQNIPSPKVRAKQPQIFTVEELGLLFSGPDKTTIMGLRDIAILKTLYAAGLRVAEIAALELHHIQDSGGYMRIAVEKGKGDKSRTLTIRTTASRALREWLICRTEIETEHRYVFVSLKGAPTPYSRRAFQLILKKYAILVGMDDGHVFAHKMRSTFATHLYDSGDDNCKRCGHPVTTVGLIEVCEAMGHSNIETTRRYIAISNRILRKTAIPDRNFQEIDKEVD